MNDKKERRFVIQGPDQSGFAGPWSIWDSLLSTWSGRQYIDDAVVTGLETEADAKQAVKRLEMLTASQVPSTTRKAGSLEITEMSLANRRDYLIAHAPPIQIHKSDEEYRPAPTPEEQARHAVRFAEEVLRQTSED